MIFGQNGLSSFLDGWNIQFKVSTTQVCELMVHAKYEFLYFSVVKFPYRVTHQVV